MNPKRLALTGYLAYAVLLILSIVLYKERTVFLDIPYHLFYILKDHSFAIQNYRFGAFFTQLFPLLGAKSGLSLPAITLLYSTSFLLLQLIVFSILIWIKETKTALAYLLFTTVMTTHTFYWIQSELPQAMAFLFLFAGIFSKAETKGQIRPAETLICCLLLLIVSFTHPLMIFAFGFLMIFWMLHYPAQKKIVLFFFLYYLILYAIKSFFFKTNYDSHAMDALKNNIAGIKIGMQSNKNYAHYFIRDYYTVTILLGVLVFHYLRQKKVFHAVFILLSFAGYSLIVNTSYAGGADQFYLENQYLVLGFMVTIPFAIDVIPQIGNTKMQTAIIAVICAACIFRIYNTHYFYTTRLNWNRQQIARANTEHKKMILPPQFAPKDTLLQTWATSYEIWLLSTIENNHSASVIVEEQPGEFDWAISNRNAFIVKWGCFDYTTLDPQYFKFSDTSSYIKLH